MLAGAPASSVEAVPTHGLSLAALRAFCEAHAGEVVSGVDELGTPYSLPFGQLTTGQVCHSVVKPATLAAGPSGEPCTYADLLLARGEKDAIGRPLAATATRFVSHAWSYKFAELIAALETVPGAEEYFWIDVFVGAQHKAPKLPQDWWSGAFKQSVVDIGHTVLILLPWQAPVSLTRSWCLWEIFCTLDGEATLEVALSAKQSDDFHAFLETSFDKLESLISCIDTRTADALNKEDKAMIDDAVLKSRHGYAGVNTMIHQKLRGWLLLQASRETENPTHGHEIIYMRRKLVLARLMQSSGLLENAVGLAAVAQVFFSKVNGASAEALSALSLQGSIQCDLGYFVDSKRILQRAYRQQTLLHGKDNDNTLSTGIELARCILGVADLPAFGIDLTHLVSQQTSLFIPKCFLYPAHRAAGFISWVYSQILSPARRWGEKYNRSLGEVASFVSVIPFVALLFFVILFSFFYSGLLASYESTRRKLFVDLHNCEHMCLHAIECWGECDSRSLKCFLLIGKVYRLTGKLDDAEKAFQLGRTNFLPSLGSNHPLVLAATLQLADVMLRKCDGRQALSCELASSVYDVLREQHGNAHPETLHALLQVAISKGCLGDLSGSVDMLRYAILTCPELESGHRFSRAGCLFRKAWFAATKILYRTTITYDEFHHQYGSDIDYINSFHISFDDAGSRFQSCIFSNY
jgi:hypothetical protein